MDRDSFQLLLSDSGQLALQTAHDLQPTDSSLLNCIQKLRKHYPEPVARAAIETVLLRKKASSKFSNASKMYFLREALEQSTSEVISRYRASRFSDISLIGDWCCGIGGDLIGLAEKTRVVAIDRDLVRLAMAAENIKAYDLENRVTFVEGDVLSLIPGEVQGAFIDPDRRADGKRHLKISEYQPNLDEIRAKLSPDFPLGVKVAPGIPREDLFGLDCESEFISVDGELKECVFWFGNLRTTTFKATLLPQKVSIEGIPCPNRDPENLRGFLYEPDVAIIRAGLIANLAEMIDAAPIDTDIAYLTSDRELQTPFARCFRILEWLPFHSKRILECLRALDIGHITIAKRGSAVDVDQLARKWKLTGSKLATVILTRSINEPIAIIAQEICS